MRRTIHRTEDDEIAEVMARLAERGLLERGHEIALEHSVDLSLLIGRRRWPTIQHARRMLYLAARARGLSYPEIGYIFLRDHTTIMHALRALEVAA